MNICLINNLYAPYAKGGVETVVGMLAEAIKDRGHEVHLITLGKKESIENLSGITVHRIRPRNIFSFLDIDNVPLLFRMVWHPIDMLNISGYRKVKKILEHTRPDIVMTHNLKGIGYLIPHLIKSMRIKHAHVLHDVQLSRPSGLILFGQEKPFLVLDKMYEKICRRLFGSPDVIISPSAWLLKYYKVRGFFYHSRFLVLPNPVKSVKTQWHDAGDEKRPLVMVCIGQIEGNKGILFLIRALKKLSSRDWFLKIVGKGSLEKEVQKEIAGDSRFQWYGYVKHSKIGNIYHLADFTLVPSLCYENSPTVIYESLSYGVPVIASDLGGIGELVKDHYNGFIFEPKNEKNFLEVIKFYIDHPQEIAALRKNAIESVKEYTLDKYLKKFFTFILQ